MLLGVARVGQQVVEVGLGQLADELQPLHPKLVPRLVRPLLGDLAPPFLLLVLFDDCNNALVSNTSSIEIYQSKKGFTSSMPQCFHAPGPQVFSIYSRYYLDIQNSDVHLTNLIHYEIVSAQGQGSDK